MSRRIALGAGVSDVALRRNPVLFWRNRRPLVSNWDKISERIFLSPFTGPVGFAPDAVLAGQGSPRRLSSRDKNDIERRDTTDNEGKSAKEKNNIFIPSSFLRRPL